MHQISLLHVQCKTLVLLKIVHIQAELVVQHLDNLQQTHTQVILKLSSNRQQLHAFLLFNDWIITFARRTLSMPRVYDDILCHHETVRGNVNGAEQQSAVTNKIS